MKCKIFVAWFNTPSSLNKIKCTMESEINDFLVVNKISTEDIKKTTQTTSSNTLITTIFYKEN